MKVITIGRSSENDITVNNPNVSRHHCQIVQFDNGTYGIVDFDSTNGTFVNGQRVYGQVSLKWGDRVHIAQTELPWQQYFPAASKKRTNWWLWPTIGGAAAIMVLAVVLVLWWTGIIGTKEILYNGPEPPIATVTLEDNGVSYDVKAAEGQIIVMFDESVSHRKAVKILKNNNAKIIAQILDIQYYMVEVPVGKESELVLRIKQLPEVVYVYPNAVREVCSAVSYVMDNFYGNHGDNVVDMMKGCTPLMDVNAYNVGTKDGRHIYTDKSNHYFKSVVDKLGENESAVINMSFGPSFVDVSSYMEDYINELEGLVKTVMDYDYKDFVVVKSSGNEGVKNLEVIINKLINKRLSPKERAVFERHFILVSAKDDNKDANMVGDYPNDVSFGNYNSMITKVDISDMTAQDAHWSGTSFSSPRAAGFITTVANSNSMKVTDVLEYVRKATKKAPDHILTQELLEKEIAEETEKEKPENKYQSYGCLKYRLVKDLATDVERLELHNTCNEDIRVTGYLMNTIASQGGDNTLDFEIIVRANGTEYVDGFLENKCTITSVEKMLKKTTEKTRTPAKPTETSVYEGCPSCLIGTKWYWENQSRKDHNNIWCHYREEVEFKTDGTVEITLYMCYGGTNTIQTYKYDYNKKTGKWRIWNEEAATYYYSKNDDARREMLKRDLKFRDDKLIMKCLQSRPSLDDDFHTMTRMR